MAELLEVSESGYHAWARRQNRSKTEKQKQREQLKTLVLQIYLESNCVYGSRKITRALKRKHHITVNHKRVENIMKEEGSASFRNYLPRSDCRMDRNPGSQAAGRRLRQHSYYCKRRGFRHLFSGKGPENPDQRHQHLSDQRRKSPDDRGNMP